MKTFSDIPVIPTWTVSDVRPAIKSRRPTRAAFRRSKVRSSRGSTECLTAHFRLALFLSFLARLRDPTFAVPRAVIRQTGNRAIRRLGDLVWAEPACTIQAPESPNAHLPNRPIVPPVFLFRLRRHIHQGVPLKHRAIEVPAAEVVLHAADWCGDATPGEGRNDGAEWQFCPGGCSRGSGRRGSGLLLGSGSLLLGGAACCWATAVCCWAAAACCWAAAAACWDLAIWASSIAWTSAPATTAVRRRTPRTACASGTSDTYGSRTSARSITASAVATTAILSIIFICFLLPVSAA